MGLVFLYQLKLFFFRLNDLFYRIILNSDVSGKHIKFVLFMINQ